MDIESQQQPYEGEAFLSRGSRAVGPEQQQPVPKWLKWMPLAALIVSCCSFAFALLVLYPWHLELSKEFTELAKKIASCQ